MRLCIGLGQFHSIRKKEIVTSAPVLSSIAAATVAVNNRSFFSGSSSSSSSSLRRSSSFPKGNCKTISKSITIIMAEAASATANKTSPKWKQKTITLPPQPRGCHLITPNILKEIGKELSEFDCGLANFFLQHTSASLTINENYDTDVRHDTETFLNRIVPEGPSAPWQHALEGPDDMPAHIKSSMFGCSLTIPISMGRLNMGTWQVCKIISQASIIFQ